MYQKYSESTSDGTSKSMVGIVNIIKQLDPEQISQLYDLVHGFASNAKNRGTDSVADGKALSPREWDVLTLLANGYTRKDIADSLGISPNTAARHICNIYRKIDASSVAEATQYACAHNLGLIHAAGESRSLANSTREAARV